MESRRSRNIERKVMKIIFRQSGGYIGLSRSCTIQSRDLPGKLTEKIEKLITRHSMSGMPGNNPAARDMASYEITVFVKKKTYSLQFNDLTMPDEVSELITWLQKRGKF